MTDTDVKMYAFSDYELEHFEYLIAERSKYEYIALEKALKDEPTKPDRLKAYEFGMKADELKQMCRLDLKEK